MLDWLASARQKIEESENNPFGASVSTQEESKAAQEQDADSYYGEEGNSQDADAEKPIEIETMKLFVSGMKQLEDYLKSN